MLTVVPVDTISPALGDVIVDVGGALSGVGGAGVLGGLLTMPQPE
jgi:hypothetical protein